MSREGPEVLFGPNKGLRGSRSLLFISFKKGHTSDIRPATLSSWLKQTILLCYKQADQPALDLVQVKTHVILVLYYNITYIALIVRCLPFCPMLKHFIVLNIVD